VLDFERPASAPHLDAAAVARGAGANLLGMLARLLRPVFLIVAASLFGSVSFGVYILAWAIVDLAGKVAAMGLDKALMRYLPLAGAERTEILAHALRGVLCGSLAISAALLAAAAPLARFYRMPALFSVLALLAPAVASTAVVTVLLSALQAVQVMRGQILVRGVLDPLALIALAAGARLLFGRAAWALALAHGAAQICVIVAALAFYRRHFSLAATARALRTRTRRPGLYRFALPMWAADGLATLQSRVDLLALPRLLPDPALLGAYAIAKQVANVVNVVRFSFDPVFWPRVAAYAAQGAQEALAATYRVVTRWVATLAFPLALVLARYGPAFARVVGRDYRGPATVFVLLVLGQLANAVLGLGAHLMAMAGRPFTVCTGHLVGIAITLLAAILCLPALGATGAAAASALGYLSVTSLQTVRVWRLHRISPLSLGLAKALLAGCAMAIALWGFFRPLPMVVQLAAGLAIYGVALVLLGGEIEDRALWAALRKPGQPA
jgi:O-antigen/teichoic acid export membrane protein